MTPPSLCTVRTLRGRDGSLVCWAGKTHEGHSFLLGTCPGELRGDKPADELVAVWFSDDGGVKEVRQLTPDAHSFLQPLPPPPAAELLQRWKDDLSLQEGPIAVQPFRAQPYYIAVVYKPLAAGAQPAEPGKPHHSFWWSREYWLDVDGRLVRVARDHPDKVPTDVIVQLRLAGGRSARKDESLCQQLAQWLTVLTRSQQGMGRFRGPDLGQGVATFYVEKLVGATWPEVANAAHRQLGERSLLDRARLLLRSHYHFDDGQEDVVTQVLWPKDFQGEVALTRW